MNRVNGIRFDGLHSFYDFGMWIGKEKPDWGNPLPKVNAVEVPGMDGVLDMSEANSGEVKFNNRTIILPFAAMVPADDQERFKAMVRNALHGKVIRQIIPDEAPDWYYTGRATVEFTDLSPWRLKIVITIDAAPYAMKLAETWIDMNQSGSPEMQTVDIPTVDKSKQDWNSDLRLGTKKLPAGLQIPLNAFPSLIVRWPGNAPTTPLGKRFAYVEDADGNVYSVRLQVPVSTGEVRISLSAITGAGVDTDRVYRVLISGIGACTLHYEMLAYRYRVWNERKEVIPLVALTVANTEIESSVQIIVNGEPFTVTSEETLYEDIILRQGWNEVLVPVWTDENITNLYMVYREGRL